MNTIHILYNWKWLFMSLNFFCSIHIIIFNRKLTLYKCYLCAEFVISMHIQEKTSKVFQYMGLVFDIKITSLHHLAERMSIGYCFCDHFLCCDSHAGCAQSLWGLLLAMCPDITLYYIKCPNFILWLKVDHPFVAYRFTLNLCYCHHKIELTDASSKALISSRSSFLLHNHPAQIRLRHYRLVKE